MRLFLHQFQSSKLCYQHVATEVAAFGNLEIPATALDPLKAAEAKAEHDQETAKNKGKVEALNHYIQDSAATEISKKMGKKVEAQKLKEDPNTLCETTRTLAGTMDKLGIAIEKIFDKLLSLLAPFGFDANDVQATLNTPKDEKQKLDQDEKAELDATPRRQAAPWKPRSLDREVSESQRYIALRAYKKIHTKELSGHIDIAMRGGQHVSEKVKNDILDAYKKGILSFDESWNPTAEFKAFAEEKANEMGISGGKKFKKFFDAMQESVASFEGQPVIEKSLPEASAKYNIPVETLVAMISKESSWNPLVENDHSSAAGLAQGMVDTMRSYRAQTGNPDADAKNPHDAIMMAAWLARDSINTVEKYIQKGTISKAWHIEPSDVEKIYMTHNMGAWGYVLYAQYTDNPTQENFNKMRPWQREKIGSQFGYEKRANYASAVAEVAYHYADITNNS